MNDAALDFELEHALAVEPSPDFLVRVRVAVAAAPAPSNVRWSWAFAGGAVLATIVVLVMAGGTIRSRVDPQQSAKTLPPPATIVESPQPVPPAIQGDARSVKPRAVARRIPAAPARSGSDSSAVAASTMPEILVSAQQAAIVRRLIARARGTAIDWSTLPEPPAASMALGEPREITLAPIDFSPGPPATLNEGERP
jgi:hypothetical protein